jgi:hypothetical protein
MDLIGGAFASDGATRVHVTAFDSDSPTQYETDIDLTQNLLTTTFDNWTGVDTITIDVVAGGTVVYNTTTPTGFWAMDNLIIV